MPLWRQKLHRYLLNYLENVEGSIFTRLTGSGSCIFSVFETKKIADKAKLIINKD